TTLFRSGQGDKGSMTAIYTVLVEGSDMEEPIADEVRGVLDGHIVLDRTIAGRGHYPAVDALSSLSRVMSSIVSQEHLRAAESLRRLLSAYEAKRDFIALGAYAKGRHRDVEAAITRLPGIEAFLRQRPSEKSPFEETLRALFAAIA